MIDRERAKRTLRGAALVFCLLLGLALFVSHVLIGNDAPVYNEADPFSFWWSVVILSSAALLAIFSPGPPMVWLLGLTAGGALVNALDRKLMGPVADYIAVPWSEGMYCNIADVAIVLGLVLFLLFWALRFSRSLERV